MSSDEYDGTEDYENRVRQEERQRRLHARRVLKEFPDRDTGHYEGGYRTFRDGTTRENFGSDR